MRSYRHAIGIFTLVACLCAEAIAQENQTEKPVLRVIFFTPSDVEPPDGVRERLKEYVDYSQMFYAKWMKHWGYECNNPVPVKLDKDGYPEILFVKGRHDQASGAYRQLGFQPEVIQTACRKYNIDPAGQVWWIYTYKGPENRGFRGGGNVQRGGTSTAIYDPSVKEHLRLEDGLGSGKIPRNSKASIHELGHAFGLPHIGPLQNDKLGNSLMGPVVRAYASRYPNEERVYLTRASAALLWKHPLFSGTRKDRDVVPSLELKNFEARYDATTDTITVTGNVASEYKAHSIVIANESEATRSDYWRKCYAGRVAEDGSFRVQIDELDDSNGRLRVVCCFNNGAVVGNESGLGLSAGFVKEYESTDDGFIFRTGWAKPGTGLRAPRNRGRRPPQRSPQ